MPAGSIVLDLICRTGSLETDLGRAEKRLKAFEKSTLSTARALTTSFLGAVGAGTAIAAFGANLIRGVDDLDELSRGLGVSAVSLSELQQSAKFAGVEATQLSQALGILNTKAADAFAGNAEAALSFQRFGVSVKDSFGKLKNTEQLLGEISNSFRRFADDGARGALIADLFGQRVGPKLSAYLEQGADGLRVASGLTEKTVEDARRASAEIDKLSSSFIRLSNTLAGFAAAGANALIDLSRSDALNSTDEQLGRLQKRIASLKEQIGQRQNPEFLAALKADLAEATRRLDELRQVSTDRFLSGGRAARAADTPKVSAPIIGKPVKLEISDDARELAQFVEQLKRATEGFQNLSRAEEAEIALRERFGNLGTVPQVQELVFGLTKQADAADEAAQSLARLTKEHEALSAALGKQKSFDDDTLKSFLDLSGRSDELRKIQQTTQLEGFLAKNPEFFSPAELDRIVKGIANISDEAKELDRTMQNVGDAFGSAFEDAALEGKKLSDVLKSLAKDLERILFRQASRQIGESIVSGLGALFSGGGSPTGGGIPAGGELVIGQSHARAEPKLTKTAGAGQVINITQTVDARGSDAAAIDRAMRASEARTLAAIREARVRDPQYAS